VSYKPVVAAALSGAALRQLSYWRSSQSTETPLLAPELHEPRSRVSYSFPTRWRCELSSTCGHRGYPCSGFARRCRVCGIWVPPSISRLTSSWRLVATSCGSLRGGRGGFDPSSGSASDRAGGGYSRCVSRAARPRGRVAISPEAWRGGRSRCPRRISVIAGPRMPYDIVASLLEDGVAAEEVAGFYRGSARRPLGERSHSRDTSTATASRSALDRAMKLLLDEDVPVQLVEPLRRLLREHRVDQVQDLGWKGKKDRFCFPTPAAMAMALYSRMTAPSSTAPRKLERSVAGHLEAGSW
jgi:hypothetical protein